MPPLSFKARALWRFGRPGAGHSGGCRQRERAVVGGQLEHCCQQEA